MIGIILITIIIIIVVIDNYPPYINGNKNNKKIKTSSVKMERDVSKPKKFGSQRRTHNETNNFHIAVQFFVFCFIVV